jgi:mannose-6-phosphate isomerase-like protein (cupin superfamily)
MIRVLKQSELPSDALAHEFIGAQHGGVGACVIFVDAAPGQGPGLHRHPYVELLIVIEGTATFDDGKSKRPVSSGEMVVVDKDQPHGFVNSGRTRLRQIDIHLSPRFITDWLDVPPTQ